MAYSIDAPSDQCYEGTTCLINKLNIRDETKLSVFIISCSVISTTGQESSEPSTFQKRERRLFAYLKSKSALSPVLIDYRCSAQKI